MNVCFNGCSFTVGSGFPESDRSKVYDRLLAQKFNFSADNIAKEGSSNYTIFMRTSQAILSNKYDLIFVQWTMPNRIWLSPGPECYYFLNDGKKEFSYREIALNADKKKTFDNTLLMLNHDYQNLFDLVDYCNILLSMAGKKTQLVFTNGLVPWRSDLAGTLKDNLSEMLSDYSKELLDFDHRDDNEIIYYFTKLQNKFAQLDLTRWVNVFDSFKDNIVDIGPEGHHPGVISNQWMSAQISEFLLERKLV